MDCDYDCDYCHSTVSTERTCCRCKEKFSDVLDLTEKQIKCKDHQDKAFTWGLMPHLCPNCNENYYATGGFCNPTEVNERVCSCNNKTLKTFCKNCNNFFDYFVKDDEKYLINDYCQFKNHHVHEEVEWFTKETCPTCS